MKKQPKPRRPSKAFALPPETLRAIKVMDRAINQKRSAYARTLGRIRKLRTEQERTAAWMTYIARNMDNFGDQEAVVYLRSRGHSCEREIQHVVEHWRAAETRAFKDRLTSRAGYQEATGVEFMQPVYSTTDIRRVSHLELRNFWSGYDHQEFTIGATMFRTVEWCKIGGFDEWWEREAVEQREGLLTGGVEPLPASYWLFSMCRSSYARRLMRGPLEHVLDVLELPSYVGPNQWTVWDPGSTRGGTPVVAAHLACASFIVVATALLRPERENRDVVATALRDLLRHQHTDGWWPTFSSWDTPSVETTSAAIHALALRKPDGFERVVERASRWLLSQESDGHWSDRGHPDPVYLSVLALDALSLARKEEDLTFSFSDVPIGKSRLTEFSRRRFAVALSFPGEIRGVVSQLAHELAKIVGKERVFYDDYYKAELARPNLDLYLQSIYSEHADLIVVVVCADYEQKQWCGLEWRAIRDLIKKRQDGRVMFLRADDVSPRGLLSIDGYIDMRSHSPSQLAGFISDRLSALGE